MTTFFFGYWVQKLISLTEEKRKEIEKYGGECDVEKCVSAKDKMDFI
jgi:hypothetical protein